MTDRENEMKIEVSNGEIFDKLSILEVKFNKLTDPEKLAYVTDEFEYLQGVVSEIQFSLESKTYRRLKEVNYKLWDIEDAIRLKESENDFGPDFIELARSVYILNDERFRLKSQINKATKSQFHEQKSHRNT